MKLKNRIPLFFTMGILLCAFFSCSDDQVLKVDDFKTDIALLVNVDLKQTINDEETAELTEKTTELTFVSQLTFDDKSIVWPNPTLELPFSELFNIKTENVSVVNAENGKITSVDISIDEDNKLKIAFTKVNDSFNYMKSSIFKVVVKTQLNDDITDDDISILANTGFRLQTSFYGDKATQSIKSNAVVVTSTVEREPYYVKGDPNNSNYKSQLNVVYFVANDIKANPNFQRRISTILLKHQLFVMKWMKHWGYEEKSFGLPLDENGLIKVIVVKGEKPKAAYSYKEGAPLMKKEIEQYYTDNKLEWYSPHTLVISATNGDTSDTPFFGSGKWCYATDYEGMAYELYNIDPITGEAMNPIPLKTNLIGGLLHELTHGLNCPHVGASLSHKNDNKFGVPLMGNGNQTYGKEPTFLHHATAATLNNMQLSSTTNKVYYEATTSTLKIEEPIVNGTDITVKGSFTASVPVTDVVVRFYNSTEEFMGGSTGYTSMAWVVKPSNNTFEVTVPIKELSIRNFKLKVGATILMDNGNAAHNNLEYVYRQENNTLICENVKNDGSWEVKASHPVPNDDVAHSFLAGLVDGDYSTYLSLVKPGKSYGGVTVPANAKVWATIDFKKQIEFNTITLVNRNLNKILNPQAVSLYGSNTGTADTDWVAIKTGVDLPEAKTNVVNLSAPVKYKYLKMTYDKWDTTGGSTMQFSEIEFTNAK